MLKVVTVTQAIQTLSEQFRPLCRAESVPIEKCCGFIAAEDIIAAEDVPPFSRSVMDGYALRAADSFGSSPVMPSMLTVTGEISMGETADLCLAHGECAVISTGGMMPRGADSVIPVEYTEQDGEGTCLLYKSVSPHENVNLQADDVRRGQTVIEKGTTLQYMHTGVLASLGYSTVQVISKPVVGIISTGNELTDITEPLVPGKIRDVNSFLLEAMVTHFGCLARRYGIISDVEEEITAAVQKAAGECDVVLLSGGSSAGAKDMTAAVIEKLGKVFIHGIAMKPGKPTVIGEIHGKPVIGLPGHPAACCFVSRIILKPLFDRLLLRQQTDEPYEEAVLTENISSNHGREEYICIKKDGQTVTPLYAKSGVISLLSRCDGFIRIERDCEGLPAASTVKVYRF